MAQTNPGFSDLLGALGSANPLSAIGKTVDQFRRAVDDLLRAVEAFTSTMDTLNVVARRVNRLMDDVEEPIRSAMPQFSATVKTVETMVGQLTSPIDRVAPLISSFADTLSAPSLAKMPEQLGEFLDVLGEVTERLAPFGAMLESAGGLFRTNPLRSVFGALDLGAARPPRPAATLPTPATAVAKKAVPKKAVAKKAVAKKAVAKKAVAKKAVAKKAVAKKAVAKKAVAKKAVAKKAATRSTAARPR
jgi:ABC-type transporter Mla subunit MlaD